LVSRVGGRMPTKCLEGVVSSLRVSVTALPKRGAPPWGVRARCQWLVSVGRQPRRRPCVSIQRVSSSWENRHGCPVGWVSHSGLMGSMEMDRRLLRVEVIACGVVVFQHPCCWAGERADVGLVWARNCVLKLL